MVSKVKKIMEKQGYTVRSFSEKTSMTIRTIMKARDHRHILNCRLGTLISIAEALDVEVHELWDRHADPEDDDQATD